MHCIGNPGKPMKSYLISYEAYCKNKKSRIWTFGEEEVYIAGMDWQAECRRIHDEGLLKLNRDGCLPFLLRLYDDNGRALGEDLILQDGLDDITRKRLLVYVLEMFPKIHLPAALVQSDTRAVNGVKFRKYFGLPAVMPHEEFQKIYGRILTERFDGTAANLPQEVWNDMLFTTLKGPQILPINYSTFYTKDATGQIKAVDTVGMTELANYFLPDWWNTTIQ
jgi:hypothetical protein